MRIEQLGAIADLRWGDTSTTKASYVDSGATAYSASGPDGFLPTGAYNHTGIVLSAIGADCGKTWLAKGSWSCIKNTIRFWSTDPEVDTEYLYWLTRDPNFWPKRGSAQPFISQGDARAAKVALPPIREQRAISYVLGKLDEKIELNRKLSATLESLSRALYKSWFVDFEPVFAKRDGGSAFMDESIWSVFPSDFDNNGKPVGWANFALRDAADVISGGTPRKNNPKFWNGSIPWISPKAMTHMHVFDSEDRVTEEALGNGTRLVSEGSTLVMVRGMGLHQGVRISQARRDVSFNQDVKAIVPKAISATQLLFGLLDASPYLFASVESSGHGTGVLPTEALERISFVGPSQGTVAHETLLPIIQAYNDRIFACANQNTTLSLIRDSLIPRLLSGELRAPSPFDVQSAVA